MARNPEYATINFAAGEVQLPVVVSLIDHRTGETVKRHRDWVVKAVNKKSSGDYNKFVAEYTSRPRNKKEAAPVHEVKKPVAMSRVAHRMHNIANG